MLPCFSTKHAGLFREGQTVNDMTALFGQVGLLKLLEEVSHRV